MLTVDIVVEVEGAIGKMIMGRATRLDEIPMNFERARVRQV